MATKVSEYLKVAEAAELLGVSKDTLRRWDRAGKLQARRHPVSGFRLYLRSELEDFLGQFENTRGKGTGPGHARKAKRGSL